MARAGGDAHPSAMSRFPGFSMVFLLLAACGGGSPGGGGGVVNTSSTFTPAAHTALPQVTSHGSTAFSAPQLVTVTWADTPFRDDLERFGTFVVDSDWLKKAGSDYGVGPGSVLANVRLTENAPAALDDNAIFAELERLVNAGELPPPSASAPQIIYLLYFPGSTQITAPDGSRLCENGNLAYHSGGTSGTIPFAYGVVPDCMGLLNELTAASSHEIIEAATDALPGRGFFLDVDADDPWSGVNGFEVADLCPNEAPVQEQGFLVTRSWSNSAAKAGASPCVPIPPGEVYVSVTASPAKVVDVAAGGSTSFTLTGWSTAETPPFKLSLFPSPSSQFTPGVQISSTSVANGGTTTLTLTVPPGTAPGQTATVLVFAGDNGGFYPVTIRSK